MGTILIIEDEQNVAELIKDRLEMEGYDTRIAYTGSDAAKQLKDKKPDLITLDIVLPDTSGLNILKDLKANPSMEKIPVIVISSADEEKNSMNLGAEKFVKKPINFNRLFEIIDQVKKENKMPK